MHTAECRLESVSPISFSRQHYAPHLDGGKESHQAYEDRTWREKCHVNDKGNVIIPATMFKESLAGAAKHLAMKIKGKGMKTWSKSFLSGVLVVDPIVLPVKKEAVRGETLPMNADGRKGSGTRVPRTFPVIDKWEGTLVFHILDDLIDESTFKYHLEQAGMLVGLGRFRPAVGGILGRFQVKAIKWK